eukprot:GAHX01000500.1.p1 GENE.GAHX01000500.1~~GAHX01000500.1.p1  ORF type:complete len:410 (-),score=107.75 GAHX01000500.1:49-1239(-)
MTFGGSQDTEYYDILDVKKDAGQDEIKRAYRKKALKLHPDRPIGDAEQFKKLSSAYKVLSDPDQRSKYDQFGKSGLGDSGFSSDNDLFSFVSKIFGGGGGFGGSGFGRRAPTKTPDTEFTLVLTLEELFKGVTKKFRVKRKILCTTCEGTGSKSKISPMCHVCKGQGKVTRVVPMGPHSMMQSVEDCTTCNGTGKNFDAGDKCPECKAGKIGKPEEIRVTVNAGADEDENFVFENMADEEKDKQTGDFVVNIKQKEHKTFQRIENDLIFITEISLDEALHGFILEIDDISGKEKKVKVSFGKTVMKPGDVKRVSGLGMPINGDVNKRGDLFIRINIKFPEWDEANSNKDNNNIKTTQENVYNAETETYSEESLAEYIERIKRRKNRGNGGFGFSFF